MHISRYHSLERGAWCFKLPHAVLHIIACISIRNSYSAVKVVQLKAAWNTGYRLSFAPLEVADHGKNLAVVMGGVCHATPGCTRLVIVNHSVDRQQCHCYAFDDSS